MPLLQVSRFTFVEPLSDGRVGLFNTLTRALGILPEPVWRQAAAGREAGCLAELVDQGFLIEACQNEDLILTHWRASQAYDTTFLTYLLSPTHACNMACSYCVHGGKKRVEHMDSGMARAVLDFIISDLESKRPLSVQLDFCGAEALLNPKVIVYLAEGLARFCRGRKVAFKSSLITNGLAVTPDLVTALKPFGLDRIRVTISGPADIHDHYRPGKDHRPTYRRIMNNLSAVAGLIDIDIIGQYDPFQNDYLRFPELLDDLVDRGLAERIGRVSFGPILPAEPARDEQPARISGLDCFPGDDPGRYIWLQDQVKARGFQGPEGPPFNRCLANYRNTMVIDVGGQITACPSIMDEPALEYGRIGNGIDFRREARLLARPLPAVCRHNCSMAPLCDGGCRHQALVRHGNFDAVHCLKESYEYLIRAYIQRSVHGVDD